MEDIFFPLNLHIEYIQKREKRLKGDASPSLLVKWGLCGEPQLELHRPKWEGISFVSDDEPQKNLKQ